MRHSTAMDRSAVVVIGLMSLVGGAASARAGVITQTIAPVVETQGPSTGGFVRGDLFSPAVGTLTGVTLELKGVLIPQADIGGATVPPTLTPSLTVAPVKLGPDSFTRTFASEPAVNHGVVGEGPSVLEIAAAVIVDETFAFTDLTRFEDVHLGPQPVVDFGFSTSASSGVVDLDRSNFNGDAILTYAFSSGTTPPVGVPEPASAAVLGIGAVAFAATRRSWRGLLAR